MQAGNNFAKGAGKEQEVAKVVAVARVTEVPEVAVAAPVVAKVAEAMVAPAAKQPDPLVPASLQPRAEAPVVPPVEVPAPAPQAPTPPPPQQEQVPVQEQPQPWYKRFAAAVKNAFGAGKAQEAPATPVVGGAQGVIGSLAVHSPQGKNIQRALHPPHAPTPPSRENVVPSPTPQGQGQGANRGAESGRQ